MQLLVLRLLLWIQSHLDKDEAHRLALQHQTLSAQLESLQQNMTRLTSQVESYANREKQLAEYLQQADVPIPALKEVCFWFNYYSTTR